MQHELRRVIELQGSWSSVNTPEMAERGQLIRAEVPKWLNNNAEELAVAIDIPLEDFFSEGRDGTGRKTRVPWVRFGSQERSPSATDGFYVVYLWAFDDNAVYLSLNQGTTDFTDGAFVRKDAKILDARVKWARSVLAKWVSARTDIVDLILGDAGEHSLGSGYELGNVASIRYAISSLPGDDQLLLDAVSFSMALGQLYRIHAKGPLPNEVPELIDLEDAVDKSAGKKRPVRGMGFRQSKEERDLVEKHAVKIAKAYYNENGWTVTEKGAPFDLELTRNSERWTVEVKGTTSMGEAVILTRGEVEYHAEAYPNNALVVVRGIVLDKSTSPPGVAGGVLFEQQPWNIDSGALKVIAYQYTVPTDLYKSE